MGIQRLRYKETIQNTPDKIPGFHYYILPQRKKNIYYRQTDRHTDRQKDKRSSFVSTERQTDQSSLFVCTERQKDRKDRQKTAKRILFVRQKTVRQTRGIYMSDIKIDRQTDRQEEFNLPVCALF